MGTPRALVLSLSLIVAVASCFPLDCFDETLRAAEAGDADSQHKLGNIYCTGEEVPQDYREAVTWYAKAAEQGHAEAMYRLGDMY